MTRLAGDAFVNMDPMAESHERRQNIYALPADLEGRFGFARPWTRHRFYRLPVERPMTALASLNRRNAGGIRKARVSMTIATGDIMYPGMHAMAERYRLPNGSLRQPRPLGKPGDSQTRKYPRDWYSDAQDRAYQLRDPSVIRHSAHSTAARPELSGCATHNRKKATFTRAMRRWHEHRAPHVTPALLLLACDTATVA